MTKRQIFYSFHFDNDVFRVQMVRQMGVIEGNEPVSKNTWETVKGNGDAAIEKWIDDNMKGKSCVVVLIGTDTSKRPWVNYEIKKAWKDGKGLLGVHIHNLSSMNAGKCTKGKNPFDSIKFTLNGKTVVPPCYDPSASDAYGDISKNLAKWVEEAIKLRTA
jgi:hypothetical protein